MSTPRDQLVARIRAFLSGEDRSQDNAREIEGLLTSHFADHPAYQVLEEDLALYEPLGGEFYVGQEGLAKRLAEALALLTAE